MDLPNRQDLFEVGRRAVFSTPNTRINPAVADIQGSDVNLALGAMSLIAEEVVARVASCMSGVYVETAVADALDRVAFDRFGLTRFPTTPARVDLVLSRASGGTGGTIPAGTRAQTASGVQFATDLAVVFSPSDLTKTVAATALLAGVDGNVSSGLVNQLVDTVFDASIGVNNPSGAAGGTDVETDVEFRGRIRAFFPTVRRGTLGAIQFGALQVPGIAIATAVEVTNPDGMPAAAVQLIVGDRAGNSTSGLLTAVRDKLLEFRACGIPVQVIGGVVQYVTPVTWRLAFPVGVDTVKAAEEVRAVTVAAAQFLDPGATLFRSTLIAAARTVPNVIVRDDSLVAPEGDVTTDLDPTIILRIRPTDVNFTYAMARSPEYFQSVLGRTTDTTWLAGMLDNADSRAVWNGVFQVAAYLEAAMEAAIAQGHIYSASGARPGVVLLALTRADATVGFTIPKGYVFRTQAGVQLVLTQDHPVLTGVPVTVIPLETVRQTEAVNSVKDPFRPNDGAKADILVDPGSPVISVSGTPVLGPPGTNTSSAKFLAFFTGQPLLSIVGASSDWLRVNGRERGVERQAGEQDAEYRLRVRNIPDVVSPFAVADAVLGVAQRIGLTDCLILEPYEDYATPALKAEHGLGILSPTFFDVSCLDDPTHELLGARESRAYFRVELGSLPLAFTKGIAYEFCDSGFCDDFLRGYLDGAILSLLQQSPGWSAAFSIWEEANRKRAGGVQFDVFVRAQILTGIGGGT